MTFKHTLICLLLFTLTSCVSTPSSPKKVHRPNPNVALVLGGGGAKGLAHIGVLMALHEHGITPDLVVGTSSGAIIGAIYATGTSPYALKSLALTTTDDELLDISPSKQGLIEGKKLRDFINKHTKQTPIQDLPIRFVAVATHMRTGQMTAFETGETGLIVQASAAVPKLFIAPRIPETHGQKYVDGGRSALVPVQVAKNLGAKTIIAVDVLTAQNPSERTNDILDNFSTTQMQQNFWQLFTQSQSFEHTKSQDVALSDVVITPNLTSYSVFDTHQKSAMIDAGYHATLEKIHQIKAVIHHNNQAQ